MCKMTHPFFHDAPILVSVGVFLTHRFETVGVFAHFLCVKNTKTPSIWSSKQLTSIFNKYLDPGFLMSTMFNKKLYRPAESMLRII